MAEPVHRLLAHTAERRAELAAPDFTALCGEAVALVRELLLGASVTAAARPRIRRRGDAGGLQRRHGDFDVVAGASLARRLARLRPLAVVQG